MSDPSSGSKWKGILMPALRKVQKQVQPTLTVNAEALVYLEDLLLQLLQQLCSSQPHNIVDIEDYIQNKFPPHIRGWAMDAAKATIEKKKKKTLTLPVDKLHLIIQKELLGYKIETQLTMYIVAVVEYISADILKLAGNYVKNIRNDFITAEHVKVAMYADPVLMMMFHNEDTELHIEPVLQPLVKRGSLSYAEVLKDFVLSEEQYIRELNLIIKVFMQPMSEATDLFSEDDLESIFCNLVDIHEMTVQFFGMIEYAFDVTDEGKEPLIGDCFGELVEAAEFDSYDVYADSQLEHDGGTCGAIREILQNKKVVDFFKEKGLLDVFKYILPKLLYGPIYHFADYFEYINLLMCTSPDGEDREEFDMSLSALRGLQLKIEKMMSLPPLKRTAEDKVFHQRSMGTAVPNATAKIVAIQENIEGWVGKHISEIASLFLKEGILIKPSQDGKKATERKVFLFDNLMVLTKPNQNITGFSRVEYRFKERINLRKIEIRDIDDTEDLEHCFEIRELNEAPVLFSCKDDDAKYEWLAILMTLQHRSTLDRMLDVILQEEEQTIQLKLPEPSIYKFSEEDSNDNIIFEEQSEDDTGVCIIKGGTLYKLVERLTYHRYADPTFVRVFLTTYRSFTTPAELLDLLIKRYDIPEPCIAEDKNENESVQCLTREEMKRFKKEYVHPIQLRVLNVLRHWVDQHFYDFTREDVLGRQLMKFLKRVHNTKTAKKWVETIEKLVQKRLEAASLGPEMYTFNMPPPPVEWHLTKDPSEFSLLTLHPLEIGRQLTIMQSEIFRAIRPSELVGTVWMKKDKEKLSPNALRMIRFSNRLTTWYELCLCEAQNFEERVGMFTRIVDILMVFQELNNFNGMMEIIGAINSSPIFRLKLTQEELQKKSPNRYQALRDAMELTDDGHHVKYNEKLRSINPPCVPFLGPYLSNILRAEDGNPDFLPNTGDNLINFSKRRMVADITGEIQKYQNMPYNLEVNDDIRQYLDALDPCNGRETKEINDYLFDLSLKIEPRNSKKPLLCPRSHDLPLKSPGIKPGQSKYGTAKKNSLSTSSLFETEVPATPTFMPPKLNSPPFDMIQPNFMDELDGGDEDEGAFEEEEPPPPLPPPPRILPKEGKNEEIPPTIPQRPPAIPPSPTSKRHSQKSMIAPPVLGMVPIEEEEAEIHTQDGKSENEKPKLPPRQSISSCSTLPNQPPPRPPNRTPVRARAESAPSPPGLPPRRPPLKSRNSESSIGMDRSIEPPDLPPRRSKK